MMQVDTEGSNLTKARNHGIMKTMFPPGYYQNGFVATHAIDTHI